MFSLFFKTLLQYIASWRFEGILFMHSSHTILPQHLSGVKIWTLALLCEICYLRF